jgi:2-methylaconitate cis-trans-isomerase PrpF
MRKFKAALMRGGVCRGLFFMKDQLPDDRREWDQIFLQGIGGPDPKQLDGVGGTTSSNSKAMVIWPSNREDADLEYIASQIDVGKPSVNYNANCGNLTAAVGLFAVEEGLVKPASPTTEVRAFNHNSQKMVTITVPTAELTPDLEGDFVLEGIDGTWPEIIMRYHDPAGAKTGSLYPTGNSVDRLSVEGFGEIDATLIDISHPMVIVRAGDVGMTGTELPHELDAMPNVLQNLEKIRCAAACAMGFAKDFEDATENCCNLPTIGAFTSPVSYPAIGGAEIAADDMDVCMRIISVRMPHRASPIICINAVSAACALPETIISRKLPNLVGSDTIRIGHPSGIMAAYPDVVKEGETYVVKSVAMPSSARRIMDGTLYIRY